MKAARTVGAMRMAVHAANQRFDPPPSYEAASAFIHMDDLNKDHIKEIFAPIL